MIDPAEALRTRFSVPTAFSAPAEVSAPVAEKGSVFGLEAELMADPAEELQDSMEELAGQFEEKAMKEIGQRKLGAAKAKMSPAARAIEKWLRLMPDMPQGQFLDKIIKELKDSDNRRFDPKSLLKLLERGSSDPSHLHAMLDVLEQAFLAEKGDRAETLKLIRATAKELEAEKGPEIRAGLNIAEEVNARGRTAQELRELRDLYRGEVLGFEKPQDCFRSLLAARGAGRLAESIDFLLRSAGVDLQSAEPSLASVQLRAIILDLQSGEILRTVLDDSTALLAKLTTGYAEHPAMDGEGLTGGIVKMTETPFVSSADVAALVTGCGIQQLVAQLYFTTSLSGLFRRLSSRLFPDENGRLRLLEAAQEHLDGLVSLEEEAEREAEEAVA